MKLTRKQIADDTACNQRITEIKEAMYWFGFPVTSEFDVCENGEVWIGLTQILPAIEEDEDFGD